MRKSSGHWGESRIFLRLVSAEQDQIHDAEERQVNQLVFGFLCSETAADEVRNSRDVVLILYGSGNGNRARTMTLLLTNVDSRFLLAVDEITAVCGDVDICRVELTQTVNCLVYLFNAMAFHWRKHLK